ncbi:hypothetical protein MB46_13620 [Arthrobacter alpinus]|uniref:DUF2264 domain-containing protein n=1 Tax=Arthrobacter alpinus TaxID=656366 RepID=UPI0005C806C8|nr:DUF2264 domain-containing protein [Arthrobacter alpinus]ALV46369.1 hypothetical protein MB46_13620 [Arthrobacter alpinus]
MSKDVIRVNRPLNWERSPYTGWTREHFGDFADSLLLKARQWAGPHNSHITPPGAAGGYGRKVDGLEGFARTAMLAGFRLAGDNGADPHGFGQWYAEGFRHGTDPHSPYAWVRPDEHDQAKVEAAALALFLDHTRTWVWDRMESRVQEQIIAYFSHVIHADYPPINWVWFRIVVEQFLKSVGAPYSAEDIESDLARHDTFVRGDGWYADGDERAFDHYNGWALHLYPVLWHRMAGTQDELAAPRRARDLAYLDTFLPDAVNLVGADGSPLIQGRSLIYRFAAAAPYWAGALADSTAVAPGQLRRAASGIIQHFATHGAPNSEGALTLGWHHEWPPLAQSYSGPGSPYWASKGLAGLILPPSHPVWSDQELPLPIERADTAHVLNAPGWLLTGTKADGIVRVLNHGNDHSLPGTLVSDSPLYARLGYSTATAPIMAGTRANNPLDQSVTLTNSHGEASHRAGFDTLFLTKLPVTGNAAESPHAVAGASRAFAHWVVKDEGIRDHGSGYGGVVTRGVPITTVSIARGEWEVRLVRVDRDANPDEEPLGPLTVGGWPLPSSDLATDTRTDTDESNKAPWVLSSNGSLSSSVHSLSGFDVAGHQVLNDATPLAATTTVPWLATEGAPIPGRWYAGALRLGAQRADPDQLPHLAGIDPMAPAAVVVWPDGNQTDLDLPEVASP